MEYLQTLDQSELLPGAFEYLTLLKSNGVKIALGSASKNASIILDKLGIAPFFDAILDGNCVKETKPDPEIFIKSAEAIGVLTNECVVYEDSQAGIQAAKAAGCGTVGIGNPSVLLGADRYVDCLAQLV